MNSHANERFWEAFQGLPAQVQRRARRAYRTFRVNPFHPSLQFKQVHPRRPIFAVRVGLGYRALGVREGEDIVWFWVGTHSGVIPQRPPTDAAHIAIAAVHAWIS